MEKRQRAPQGDHRCKHLGCRCLVQREGAYCSARCRELDREDKGKRGRCRCGHVRCATAGL